MLIPVPLCAVHVWGDFYVADDSIVAAFVVLDSTLDISSSFHTQGQRVGDQSGLYGAYIDEGTVPSYSYGTGFDYPINVPANQPRGQFVTTQTTLLQWPVSCGWTDGTYYYAALGYAQATASWFYSAQDYWVSIKNPEVTGTVYRCAMSELDGKIQPGRNYIAYNYDSYAFTVNDVDLPTVDSEEAWTKEDANSILRSTWNKYEVSSVFEQEAHLATVQAVWKGKYSNQPIYWPSGDFPDYTRIFSQLLTTYSFNDPLLANGAVASEAHYEIKEEKNFYGSTVTKNVWIPRGGPFGTYEFEWLTQHAFMDAVESIPKANDNSIQNIMALVELLVAIKNMDLSEIPDLLMKKWEDATRNADAAADAISDMWMRYRYEYSTTKMDIEEYVKYGLEKIDRYMMSYSASRTHGTSEYNGTQCRCALSWKEKGLTGLNKFCHALWEQGLEPNSYVLWDFVPFSFVADWFVPIGDTLQVFSDSQYLNAGYYEFSDIVFSIRYRTGPIAGVEAEHYVRWVAKEPPIVDESYWFDTGQSSTGIGTIAKRVMDSGCLLYGLSK